ncbi:hypothetical protein [Mesorhizobium sp. M0848]
MPRGQATRKMSAHSLAELVRMVDSLDLIREDALRMQHLPCSSA